jgi:hypothetical protein
MLTEQFSTFAGLFLSSLFKGVLGPLDMGEQRLLGALGLA